MLTKFLWRINQSRSKSRKKKTPGEDKQQDDPEEGSKIEDEEDDDDKIHISDPIVEFLTPTTIIVGAFVIFILFAALFSGVGRVGYLIT